MKITNILKENSRLLSATVKVKEISNFHENGILNYQLSIIKRLMVQKRKLYPPQIPLRR